MEKESALRFSMDKQGHNNPYFQNYLRFLDEEVKNDRKSPGTVKQYQNKVKNFLNDFYYKEVSNISLDDIEIYLVVKNVDKQSVMVYALMDFFKFIGTSTTLTFNLEDIKDRTQKEADDKRSPQILSIDEIIRIRSVLKEKNNYEYLYVFEMFYTYGLSLDQIVQCTLKNFDSENKIFEISRPRKVKLNRILAELVTIHPDLLRHNLRYWYQAKNKSIGEMIDREEGKKGLVLKDYQVTRETYFPTCPICKERYPNTDEYWALVIDEADPLENKWFWCKHCVSQYSTEDNHD